MSEEAIAESCPYCRGNCNCKACLRRKDAIEVGYAVFHFILPFMQDCKQQLMYD